MKRQLSIALILSLFISSNAQEIFDAINFSNNSIVNGTARYMSMSGSFGAIGGDVSASIDNPATLGIFRSSEASVSLGFTPTTTKSDWQNDKFSSTYTPFSVNQFAWVFHIPTYKESGYMSSSLSLSYHKIKDFNRKIYLQSNSSSVVSLTDLMADFLEKNSVYESDFEYDPYGNVNIGWLSVLGYESFLIDPIYNEDEQHTGKWTSILGRNETVLPAYEATERGNIGEYNFTYSGNVNDKIYFGAGLSMLNISREIHSIYSEEYIDYGDYFDLNNYFITKGYGVNLKLGAIVRATDFLRLGLSFQSPSWYWLKDWHTAKLEYFEVKNSYTGSTPEADYLYSFSSPVKVQASVGFTVGKRAAINLDYQFSGKKYSMSDDYGKFEVDADNYAKYLHTLKLGAELRLGECFKIRAGGAFISAPISQDAVKLLPYNTTRTDAEYFVSKNTYYGTCGIGYAKGGFCIDLAYAYQQQNQNFFAAENFENFGATLRTHKHNVIATVAFRY